jgi:hypothetical protein
MHSILTLEDAEAAIALALEREEPADVIRMGREKFKVSGAMRSIYD